MRTVYNILIFGFSTLGFSSCEKPEEPVEPAKVQGQTSNLGPEYKYQEYYNILSNTFVQSQEHYGWDLSFESHEDGKYIYLNSSNFVFIRSAGNVDFQSVLDTNYSSPWKYDYPTGESHRTAFGEWMNADNSSKNEVYIVNRGTDEVGFSLGFFKIQILSVNSTSYTFRVAELDNTGDTTITILKNPDKRWVQFNFGQTETLEFEPDNNNWHLLFTQYTDFDITTDGDTIPYLVRGALLNAHNVEAVLVDNVDFGSINLDLVSQLNFSDNFNTIGYNWKYFSIDTGVYTVKEGMNYVLKEKNGTYFKLRFLGFYDNNGDKGYPSFEIVSL